MNQILNLTQHFATPAQTQAGVHEPVFKSQVQNLITFDSIPTEMGMRSRAQKLAYMTKEDGYQVAMIGGASFFMAILEDELKKQGIKPVYAFSQRESVDKEMSDGSVQKVNVFKHIGFYEVN